LKIGDPLSYGLVFQNHYGLKVQGGGGGKGLATGQTEFKRAKETKGQQSEEDCLLKRADGFPQNKGKTSELSEKKREEGKDREARTPAKSRTSTNKS